MNLFPGTINKHPSVWRRVSSLLVWLGIALLVIFAFLGIIGGGWSNKPPLPAPLADAPRPLLLSHRGVTTQYPENSLGAIHAADSIGFPGLEIDIQYTHDSAFVVLHDYDMKRMFNYAGIASEMTLAQLRTLPLLHADTATDQTVPALTDVIERYSNKFVFYFDMKRHGHDGKIPLAADIARFIDSAGITNRTMVASAHVWFICWLEYNYPQIVTVLEGIDPGAPWLYTVLPTRFRPDLIASRYNTVSEGLANWLVETGLNERYVTYHIEPEELPAALNRGLTMFIIDYEQPLNRWLHNE